MSRRAVLTLVAASLLAAGCGTSKPTLQRPSAPTEPINADPAKPARDAVQAGLRKYPLTDPRGVVFMLWRRMQQGIPQLGMQLYEPGVVQRLGVAAVEGGLATQGSLFRAYAPVVEKPEPTKIGFLVNVTATNPGHPVVHYTFLLRRNATGGWYISYDSLLEDGLIAYGRQSVDSSLAQKFTTQAALKGDQLAERYRVTTTGVEIPGAKKP